MTTLPLASVYTHALQGHPCTVWEGDLAPQPLPTHTWLALAGDADRAVLAHCHGSTIDIGCGPGRMTEALALAGHAVLGIDVVPEAVRQTRLRGVPALRRSVFDRLPGEGRWDTALLADGNIGIGGDPVALLERAAELVAPHGHVVADVAPRGTGVVTRHVRLETSHGLSGTFP
jgi:SAM-dependent methyltransferase